MTEGKWENTSKAHDIHKYAMEAAQVKELGETHAKAAYERSKATSPRIQELDYKVQRAQMDLTKAENTVKANQRQFAAGHIDGMVITPEGLSASGIKAHRQRLASDLQNLAVQAKAEERRAQSADGVLSQITAERFDADELLRKRAAGIDSAGVSKIQATALNEITEAKNKNISAAVELLKSRALQEKTTLKALVKNMAEEVRDGSTRYDEIEVEAAFEALAQDGQIYDLELSRLSSNVNQSILSNVIARNAGTMKQKGGFHLQENPRLANASQEVLNVNRAGTLADTPATAVKDLKQGWVEKIAKQMNTIIQDTRDTDGGEDKLRLIYSNIHEALNNPQIQGSVSNIAQPLKDIENALAAKGFRVPSDWDKKKPNRNRRKP